LLYAFNKHFDFEDESNTEERTSTTATDAAVAAEVVDSVANDDKNDITAQVIVITFLACC